MWRDRLDKTREDTGVWLKVAKKKVQKVLTTPWRIFKMLVFFLGLSVMGTLVVAYFVTASFFDALPHTDKMVLADLKAQAVKRMEAKVVNKRYRHRWVPMNDISRDLLFSIVMSEDSTFFEHSMTDSAATSSGILMRPNGIEPKVSSQRFSSPKRFFARVRLKVLMRSVSVAAGLMPNTRTP